jgi:hypothetical protein
MLNNHDTRPSPAAPDTQLPALSPRRLTARRANAQKCTGPRTPEGKATTRLNAPSNADSSPEMLSILPRAFLKFDGTKLPVAPSLA